MSKKAARAPQKTKPKKRHMPSVVGAHHGTAQLPTLDIAGYNLNAAMGFLGSLEQFEEEERPV